MTSSMMITLNNTGVIVFQLAGTTGTQLLVASGRP
jgi:hypothetical protein